MDLQRHRGQPSGRVERRLPGNYRATEIGAISSGGVGSTTASWTSYWPQVGSAGESACVLSSGGCPLVVSSRWPRGTSEFDPAERGRRRRTWSRPTAATQRRKLPPMMMIEDIISSTRWTSRRSVRRAGLVSTMCRAVAAAQQMPATDVNGPPADALGELVEGPSPARRDGCRRYDTTKTSLSLYNTNASSTTVTGAWRSMGPQFDIHPGRHGERRRAARRHAWSPPAPTPARRRSRSTTRRPGPSAAC